MKVDRDMVTPYQKRLLEEAKDGTSPRRLFQMLTEIIEDRQVISGRESVHPDWLQMFQENRVLLKDVSPGRRFREIDEFFTKMSPIDPEVSDLHPKGGNISFLLGAGASKPDPSNIPTVKELLPDMLARARRLDREDVTRLAEFCEEREIQNIEDLLTATQLATFCSRNPNILRLLDFLLYRDERYEMHEYRRARPTVVPPSVAFLQETLQVLFGLLSSTMLPAKPNCAHKAIIEYVQEHQDSHIVTTNYDCCIDLALRETDVSFNYGLDFANTNLTNGQKKTGITLTKLHGSLNWFYCETCQDVRLVDTGEMVEDFQQDKKFYPVIGICRECDGQRRPMLVPPLAMKFDIAPPITRLLEQATKAFESAKIIVVVGFSFAEADLYISRMLSKSMQRSKKQKILIVDPDWGVVNKVRRKLKASMPEFAPGRVLRMGGDCAEMLPKFLAGEMVRKVEVGTSKAAETAAKVGS